MKVKVTQLCPTLCNPTDYTVHGIIQARILEWVAFHSPWDLPNPGIKPRSSALQMDSLAAEPQGKQIDDYIWRLIVERYNRFNFSLKMNFKHHRSYAESIVGTQEDQRESFQTREIITICE